MATRKNEIEALVKKLADLTGIPYQTDYAPQYGGYNLYYRNKRGDSRGKYGFDWRKSAKEMHNYLTDIIETIEAMSYTFIVEQDAAGMVHVVDGNGNELKKYPSIHTALEGIANFAKNKRIYFFKIQVIRHENF